MDNVKNVGPQFNVDDIKGLPIHRFLINGLLNIHWTEKHLAHSMADIIDAVSSDELKKVIQGHQHQAYLHVARLEKAFKVLNEEPKSVKSKALTTMLKQVFDIISETKDESDIREAALIMAAHRVKVYKITAYNNLIETSELIGLQSITLLLKANLEEEKSAVEKLSTLMERSLNQITAPCRRCDNKNSSPHLP